MDVAQGQLETAGKLVPTVRKTAVRTTAPTQNHATHVRGSMLRHPKARRARDTRTERAGARTKCARRKPTVCPLKTVEPPADKDLALAAFNR